MKTTRTFAILLCIWSVPTSMARLSEKRDEDFSNSMAMSSEALDEEDAMSIEDHTLDFESNNETDVARDLYGGRRPHRRPDRRPDRHPDRRPDNRNDRCPIHYYNDGRGWARDGVGCGGGGYHGGGYHGGGWDNDGAYKYGSTRAEALWKYDNDRGDGYHCHSAFPRFWKDTQKRVFYECSDRWDPHGAWGRDYGDCKDGAADFVMKKVGYCADTADCTKIGIGASASVAGAFCGKQGLYRDRDWIPRRCKKHAVATCETDSVITVQGFIDARVCGPHHSALDYVDVLHKKCYHEVERMEDEANLGLGHY